LLKKKETEPQQLPRLASSVTKITYPAGLLASLRGFGGAVTFDSQLVSLANEGCKHKVTVVRHNSAACMVCKTTKMKAYILQLLLQECIIMNQLGDLLLETLILFHEKLVHRTQLSVHSLEP
jgi:hypothetical protein